MSHTVALDDRFLHYDEIWLCIFHIAALLSKLEQKIVTNKYSAYYCLRICQNLPWPGNYLVLFVF